MATFNRISARRGNQVCLDVTFKRGGVPTDPYAIRRVEIFKDQVLEANKVAEFVFDSPCEDGSTYPSPATQVTEDLPDGLCGTEGETGAPVPGKYQLCWDIPADAKVPAVYHDVWSYIPTNPCLLDEFADDCECTGTGGTVGTDCDPLCHPNLDDPDLECLILQCCNRFWVYPDSWQCCDGLESLRFGFEPLDQKFRQPEKRPLEVGFMPLPLYDYNFNLVAPILPLIQATITIETQNKEVLVDAAPMETGLRQGSYRSNPFVFRYLLDTTAFLIGSYKYRVLMTLPDGTTRSSGDFIFTVS